MLTIQQIPSFKSLKKMTKATYIFFDMDGTLLNTEPQHAKALQETLKQLCSEIVLTIEEIHEKYHGQADNAVYEDLRNQISISFEEFLKIKNAHFLETIDNSKMIIDERMIELLKELKENKYTLALITASEKEIANHLIKKEKIEKYFDLILTREDSIKTKPSPVPYLDAVKYFKINEKDAFIFEDSSTGIQAAIDSGIQFLRVDWFS